MTKQDFLLTPISKALQEGRRPPVEALKALSFDLGFDDATVQAAVVCQAGLLVGRDPLVLLDYVGCSKEELNLYIQRLIWNGIWRQGGLLVDWPEADNDISITMDCLVATGDVRRCIIDGEANYFMNRDDGDRATVYPRLKSKGGACALTAGHVVKTLMVKHDIPKKMAIQMTLRGWLNIQDGEGHILAPITGTRADRLRFGYSIKKVTVLLDIPQETVDFWKECYGISQAVGATLK